MMGGPLGSALSVRAMAGDGEAETCARIMATSEPWMTLGRGYDASLAAVSDPDREVLVAVHGGRVIGFAVLAMRGGFAGYVQTIGVDAGYRSLGVGRALLTRIEERVFAVTPNVFLCVSSFNLRGRAFYEANGYRHVGTIEDYVVAGHDELIMRKTMGPMATFAPTDRAPTSDVPGQP